LVTSWPSARSLLLKFTSKKSLENSETKDIYHLKLRSETSWHASYKELQASCLLQHALRDVARSQVHAHNWLTELLPRPQSSCQHLQNFTHNNKWVPRRS
jgi:dTDP-4-dehydrorhamnose reductase